MRMEIFWKVGILYFLCEIGLCFQKKFCISTFYIWDRLEFDVYFIKSQMEIICYHTPNCNASSAGGIKAIRLLNFGKPLKSQIPIYLKERNHKIGRQKIINHDHDKNNSQLPIFCTSSMISGFWKLAEILIDKLSFRSLTPSINHCDWKLALLYVCRER